MRLRNPTGGKLSQLLESPAAQVCLKPWYLTTENNNPRQNLPAAQTLPILLRLPFYRSRLHHCH